MSLLNKNNYQFIDKVLISLILLLPPALLTGPFLPDFFLSCSCLIFVFISIKNYQKKYFLNTYSYFFYIFIFYLIFSSLISDHTLFSLKSSAVYFRFWLFILCIWYLLDRFEYFNKYFLVSLLVAFIIAIVSGYYQFIYSETIFGLEADPNRLLLLSSDQLLLGQYLARLFPLLVALAMYNKNNNLKVYLFVLVIFVLTDVLVYLSGERTALGLLFLSSILILILIKNFRLFRFLSIIISILFIISISVFNPNIKERNIDYTVEQLGLNNENSDLVIFSPAHDTIIRTSLNMFLANPVFGVGPNNFRVKCSDKKYEHKKGLSCQTHPHNTYVQVLGELGIIGFLFLIVINLWTLYFLMKYIYKSVFYREQILNDYQLCLLIYFICSLWPFLPTLNFFNNWINIIYFLPIGFFIHSINLKDQNYSSNT